MLLITLLLSHLVPVRLWVLPPRTVTEEGLWIWAWAQEVHFEITHLWQRPFSTCTGDLALGWTPEMVQSPFSSKGRKVWRKNGWHTNLSFCQALLLERPARNSTWADSVNICWFCLASTASFDFLWEVTPCLLWVYVIPVGDPIPSDPEVGCDPAVPQWLSLGTGTKS